MGRQPLDAGAVAGWMEKPWYELSIHAKAVMAEREIDVRWVERILAKPDQVHPDRTDPRLVHALGRVEERSGRVLRVIYNQSVDPPRIVTVYFDRKQRGSS